MKIKSFISVLALTGLLAASAAAQLNLNFSQPKNAAPDSSLQRAITIVDTVHTYDLNPYTATFNSEAQLFTALYEGLFSYDPVTLDPVNAICESYKISRNKKRWTFNLRKDLKFSAQNLLTGQLTDRQWRDVTDAAQTLSTTDIRIDDNPTLTVSDMNAQCRRVQNLDLVIIDYLQLMQSAGSGHSWSNESRTQAVSDISRMMKIMAKELNVPVVCLSQLSRANESRQDKRPMLSDLRESGAIEQDADVVIGLYRDGYYNQETENPNLAEAIVLKNRKGATGTIQLNWLPEYTSFSSLERRYDED